jgi:hypothetical protein
MFCLLAVSAVIAAGRAGAGLVHYYKFEDASLVNEIGADGINNGAEPSSAVFAPDGVSRGSYYFDSGDSAATGLSILPAQDAFTLSLWMKSSMSGLGYLLSNEVPVNPPVSGRAALFVNEASLGSVFISWGGGAGGPLELDAGEIATGDWVHLALTRSSEGFSLYVNAELVDSEVSLNGWSIADEDWKIGSNHGGGYSLNGYVDELAVWDAAMPAGNGDSDPAGTSIKGVYHNGVPEPGTFAFLALGGLLLSARRRDRQRAGGRI